MSSRTEPTTYARSTLEYDAEHERALLDAIVQAFLPHRG
jgi:hypothetical protein